MDDFPIDRMRGRARQLRRMAGMAHDPRMIDMLIAMAGEIEADIARLEAEAAVHPADG
jgi:hypothetical protein